MSDLDLGSMIAGCRLESVAGRGGMGVVYRATQLALDRPVALKAIAADLAQDAEYRERFQHESQLAASIDHPNVIPVYEAGERDGVLYLIMRWVDGTDLRALLVVERRLRPARAVALLRPVALALAAAHQRGLVHRDVKPANILISQVAGQDEHVYLTDFGIAKRTNAKGITRTGMLVGTVDYTSPERLVGGAVSFADDIYSFGCVLFEALTGHVPFDLETDTARIFAHVHRPVPSARAEVDAVPPQLDAIIARAMAKRPQDRFESARELAIALQRALAEVATDEVAVGAPQPEPDDKVLSRAPALGETRRVRRQEAPASAAAAQLAPTPSEDAPTAARPSATRYPQQSAAAHRVRPARRRALLAAGVILAAVTVGVLIALVAGAGSPASAAHEATVVDGTGLAPAETIALPATAGAISLDPQGNVWATLPGEQAVARVGPNGGAIAAFSVDGSSTAIAAGPRGTWVGSASGTLARLDLTTGATLSTARLGAGIVAIAVDPNDGSAWAADGNGNVTHIAVNGDLIGVPAHTSPQPVDVGWGEGWVWAVNGAPDGLVRISLAPGPSTTALDARPGALAVTFNQGVWTANASGDVTRFDPRPGHLAPNADVNVAPELDAIAAAEQQNSVWAISRQAKRLYRISNASAPAVTGAVAFKSAPVALAVDGTSAWVATQDGKLIRIDSTSS